MHRCDAGLVHLSRVRLRALVGRQPIPEQLLIVFGPHSRVLVLPEINGNDWYVAANLWKRVRRPSGSCTVTLRIEAWVPAGCVSGKPRRGDAARAYSLVAPSTIRSRFVVANVRSRAAGTLVTQAFISAGSRLSGTVRPESLREASHAPPPTDARACKQGPLGVS